MSKLLWQRWLWSGLVLVLAGTAHAEGITQGDRDLVAAVTKRLLAVVPTPPAQMSWPPDVAIIEDPKEAKTAGRYNAYAALKRDKDRKPLTDDKGNVLPIVRVTPDLIHDVIQGDADRLAYILGHELSHHLLGHTRLSDTELNAIEAEIDKLKPGEQTAGLYVFTRSQELAADLKGMQLVAAAGYSGQHALGAIQRMRELGQVYSSFEALSYNHPSWDDRLAAMDRNQAVLWRSMAAYDDAYFFLLAEQYVNAEECFRRVLQDFPKCQEALAGLGYALLMRYCDGLEPADLRKMDIGQLAVGGFYRRPESLQPTPRGINEQLWKEAVANLTQALKLEPNSALAKANLGVAYLVQPNGKDVKQAVQLLQEACDRMATDSTQTPLARASVLINAAVAKLAAGDLQAAAGLLRDSGEVSTAGLRPNEQNLLDTLGGALVYNMALLLEKAGTASAQKKAKELYETYLRRVSPASTWGTLAGERYKALCAKIDEKPQAIDQLTAKTALSFRPLTAIRLKSGVKVALNEPREQIIHDLRGAQPINVAPHINLIRLVQPAEGIELLVAEQVVAIHLKSPDAPPLAQIG